MEFYETVPGTFFFFFFGNSVTGIDTMVYDEGALVRVETRLHYPASGPFPAPVSTYKTRYPR